MWTSRSEQLVNGRLIRFAVALNTSPVTYREVLHCWQNDVVFRSFFINLLANCPFSAFRWETPPLTEAIAHRPFEFILLNSPNLARPPDAEAFAEHFRQGDSGGIVEFLNLGKDAILVVPCPQSSLSAYSHLGAFIRQAPEPQKHALWQQVGAAMQRRLSNKPVWLSTAGAGVSWLHVRLDERPKYYGYAPYRATP